MERRALAFDLVARGVAYRWLVSDKPRNGDPEPPSLTRRGVRLERKVTMARSRKDSVPAGPH
jgi:hypothetical protein